MEGVRSDEGLASGGIADLLRQLVRLSSLKRAFPRMPLGRTASRIVHRDVVRGV